MQVENVSCQQSHGWVARGLCRPFPPPSSDVHVHGTRLCLFRAEARESNVGLRGLQRWVANNPKFLLGQGFLLRSLVDVMLQKLQILSGLRSRRESSIALDFRVRRRVRGTCCTPLMQRVR